MRKIAWSPMDQLGFALNYVGAGAPRLAGAVLTGVASFGLDALVASLPGRPLTRARVPGSG